jgi:hypothetical protein
MAHPRDRVPFLSRETLFERIEALEARIVALTAIIQNQAEQVLMPDVSTYDPEAINEHSSPTIELPDDGLV